MPSTTTRKHAAIMFTDIVGYTALMGSNEDEAFEVLRKNREIHSKFIRQYSGTLIKEMGDGMLISFDLASDAVRCAIEIQKTCKEQAIPLKIGIHEGEMVFEGNDVLGDGVNIASRIQDGADAGFILISDSIYRDIRNKHDIATGYVGQRSFKNVEDPIKIYAINYPGCPDVKDISQAFTKPSSLRKAVMQRPFFGISSIIILLAASVTLFLFYRGTAIPFTERDWIVISDFDNMTAEEVFDHSLNTAFNLSINQSRYVNVISRQRIKETLERMQIESMQTIDEETAREIAIREGVKICLVPSISKVGDQYVLTSKIVNTESWDILKSEVLYATSQNNILNVLDQLCKKTRRILGESRYDIYSQSKPLSKVTTSSLEALQEFSLGVEDHVNLDFELARTHYENAIKIDTNFVAAKASLGNLLYERFDREEGRKWLDEAIVSIDRLTEREKYGILAFYAVNVENDLEKGIMYARSRIDMYPDDPVARNNLGWYYQHSGMYEQAVTEYKAAININPYLMIPYGGLIWIQLEKLARLDSARLWSEKMIAHNENNPWGYFYLGSVNVAFDNLEEAVKNFKKSVDLNPKLMISQYRLAHVYRMLHEYDRSIEILTNVLTMHPNEISACYDLGISYRKSGREELAKRYFADYLAKATKWEEDFPDYPQTYTSIGAGWTQLGEKEKGKEIGEKAIELDSAFHFEYAVFLSIQGEKDESLNHLEKALKNGYRDIVWIKMNPGLDLVREEERFKKLIETYFR